MVGINFVKFEPSVNLDNFELKNFLVFIGFPEIKYYDAFVIEKSKIIEFITFKDSEFVKIGELFEDSILVNLENGFVYRFDMDDLQFLNQSVNLLSYCVIEYVNFLNNNQGFTDTNTLENIIQVDKNIRRIDTKTTNEESFWFLFIKENLELIKSEL